ncbi:hypothetical protein HDU91_001352, partial [Kappamyces sp. JEL0680]
MAIPDNSTAVLVFKAITYIALLFMAHAGYSLTEHFGLEKRSGTARESLLAPLDIQVQVWGSLLLCLFGL